MLIRFGIAAGCAGFGQHVQVSLLQALLDFRKLILILNLNTYMVYPCLCSALADGEIDKRIVQHPFGVIRLDYAWC